MGQAFSVNVLLKLLSITVNFIRTHFKSVNEQMLLYVAFANGPTCPRILHSIFLGGNIPYKT